MAAPATAAAAHLRALAAAARRCPSAAVAAPWRLRLAPLRGLLAPGAAARPCARPPARAAAAEAGAEAAPPADPAAAAEFADKLDIRVGRVLTCELHPDADTLYVETVDVGEPEGPRTIVSGLVKYVPLAEMQGRAVLVLANLKPRNMRGVKSAGMLLCASNADHTEVEPLAPPEGAAVGERCWFEGGAGPAAEAAQPNAVQKKKMWEAVQPLLATDGGRVAGLGGRPLLTSAGAVTAATLAGASIS